MDRRTGDQERTQPLVEVAPEETVLRALAQSAHPVEFIEANGPAEDVETSKPVSRD